MYFFAIINNVETYLVFIFFNYIKTYSKRRTTMQKKLGILLVFNLLLLNFSTITVSAIPLSEKKIDLIWLDERYYVVQPHSKNFLINKFSVDLPTLE